MSNTPRTDEITARRAWNRISSEDWIELAEHARTLECELNEAKAKIEEMELQQQADMARQEWEDSQEHNY